MSSCVTTTSNNRWRGAGRIAVYSRIVALFLFGWRREFFAKQFTPFLRTPLLIFFVVCIACLLCRITY